MRMQTSASEAGGSGGDLGDDGGGVGPQDGSKTTRGRALELVVVRGTEVLGVRHLLAGASAWLGSADSIAPVSMASFGGRPVAIGEATTSRFYVQVPPNARARLRSAEGLPRILAGAQRLQLRGGDKVVIILGPVSVRARLVAVEGVGRTVNLADRALRWVAVLSVLYLVALGLMAWLGSTSDASGGPRRELQHQGATIQ